MKKKIVFIILIILIILGLFGIRTILSAKKALNTGIQALGAAKLQDLNATKAYLRDTKKELKATKRSLFVFTPIRIVPLIGWYLADVQRGIDAAGYGIDAAITFTEAITPYADVLGFAGEDTFLGGTAQERLASAIETLSKVEPQIDEVGQNLARAREEVDKIQSWRYPNFLPANPGTKIETGKKTLSQLESLIVDTRPLLTVLPEIMGQNGQKKYLILFQNDKELRPTGGFITAYAVFRVENGIVASEGSDDIYRLDDTLLKKISAPQPILDYLPNVNTLNLRDSNLSPDFRVSMNQFQELYQFTQDPKEIDGIIVLDTHFVLSMMKVLGPIEAYGVKFTTEEVEACACPQIIYELEKFADEPVAYEKGSRKDIIGVLMQQMMNMAFNAPKSTWPNLFETAINSLRQKHVLLNFNEPHLQEAVERINFAGRLYEYEGDYFHINEANFAGAKSNLYVQEEVEQEIDKGKDGNISKKVTIKYKYPRRMDNCSLERAAGLCLAGLYRDYIRIYVPKGSQLLESKGTTLTTSEDLGKTVFEGFIEVRPEGTAEIELGYTIPIKVDSQYKLLIQKQPGTLGHTYEIKGFGKKQKAFPLDTDKEVIIKL